MNLKLSNIHLTEKYNDLKKILKITSEERKKILLLSEITKNERSITSSKVNAPFKLNDELRKRISLKHHRNEKNREINNPINNFNSVMILNNLRIQNLKTEKSSANFDNQCENINSNNNSINFNDNNKSQIPDMKKGLNELYLFPPKNESRNIEVKIGGLESDKNVNFESILNTEGNVKKEKKKMKKIIKSESNKKNFKIRNINDEEREKRRKELEQKLERQRSEIKKRERENSENLKKKYLQELSKKKEKDEE
jgi:hypothetical protein